MSLWVWKLVYDSIYAHARFTRLINGLLSKMPASHHHVACCRLCFGIAFFLYACDFITQFNWCQNALYLSVYIALAQMHKAKVGSMLLFVYFKRVTIRTMQQSLFIRTVHLCARNQIQCLFAQCSTCGESINYFFPENIAQLKIHSHGFGQKNHLS